MTTPVSGTAGDIAYGVALAVHVVSAVVGFALLGLSGLYGAWSGRSETPEGRRDLRQYFGRVNRAGQTLWAVPVAGGVALWIHSGATALGKAWVFAALACWAVAMVLAVSVIWPAERRIRPIVVAFDDDPGAVPSPATRSELADLCRPLVRAAAACDCVFVVALALMVLQPGR
jgi:hypothetical protein